jgi:hypothetical protein
MLQALLVERFKLAFHRESRQVDGFALVRVRVDRSAGPSSVGCGLRESLRDDAKVPARRYHADTMTAVGTPNLEPPSAGDLQGRRAGERRARLTARTTSSCAGRKLERRRVTTEVVVVDRLERAAPD